ncbi:hypothetical protein BC941DRAFT_419782 [Chlamydoabsidia padenii]|nr:hypothetical protein BC941DRAFT_419782 [Chlamydoabsidia padenii]
MTGIDKRCLGWTLSTLFCIFILLRTWTWMRWIFEHTPVDHSKKSPHRPHHHTSLITLSIYLVLLTTSFLGILLAQRRQFLSWRRWWCYQFPGGDVSTVIGVSTLLLFHGLLAFWPTSTNDTLFERHRVVSDRLAQLATMDLALAVGLSARHVCHRLLHLSLTSTVWHRWFARLGLLGSLYHGCFQWTKHYYRRQLQSDEWVDLGTQHGLDAAIRSIMGTWWPLTVSSSYYFTGSLMALALVGLAVGSHQLVRERWYALFRLIHGVSSMVFLIVGIWHHPIVAVALIMMGGVWVVDMVLRSKGVVAPVIALVPVAEDIIKLQVTSHHVVSPGQYLHCSLSESRWKDIWWSHPFSISRIDSSTQMLTFYIKVKGNWTLELYEMVGNKEAWPTVRLGNPLGEPWTYHDYPVMVLIAEGIGITPWLGVLQAATSQHIYVIWTVRKTDMIEPLINNWTRPVDWQIYVTGYHLESQIESLDIPSSSSPSSTYYHQGRPHYPSLMESIRTRHSDQDVALGLCVHDDSVCANLARSKKFSHSQAVWHIRSERFDL